MFTLIVKSTYNGLDSQAVFLIIITMTAAEDSFALSPVRALPRSRMISYCLDVEEYMLPYHVVIKLACCIHLTRICHG